jgi:hypothetical protein
MYSKIMPLALRSWIPQIETQPGLYSYQRGDRRGTLPRWVAFYGIVDLLWGCFNLRKKLG